MKAFTARANDPDNHTKRFDVWWHYAVAVLRKQLIAEYPELVSMLETPRIGAELKRADTPEAIRRGVLVTLGLEDRTPTPELSIGIDRFVNWLASSRFQRIEEQIEELRRKQLRLTTSFPEA